MELGGLLWTRILNLALPPQWQSPDAFLEHQEPVLHKAPNKREERKKIYIYFPFFCDLYAYASVCDFVCRALLLPFDLGFCLSVFFLIIIFILITLFYFVHVTD